MSFLLNLAHRYLHAIMNRSIMGNRDSTDAVIIMDLFMLYSMIERYPVNMAHIVVKSIAC